MIIKGNNLYGPFLTATEAANYADEAFGPNGWDIITSVPPRRLSL